MFEFDPNEARSFALKWSGSSAPPEPEQEPLYDPDAARKFAVRYMVENNLQPQPDDTSDIWEGIKGASRGISSIFPFLGSKHISPVEAAPAPTAPGSTAARMIQPMVQGMSEAALGGVAGPAGVAAGAGVGELLRQAKEHRIQQLQQTGVDPGFGEGMRQLDGGDALMSLGSAATAGIGAKLGGMLNARAAGAIAAGAPRAGQMVRAIAPQVGYDAVTGAGMGLGEAANEGMPLTGPDAIKHGLISALVSAGGQGAMAGRTLKDFDRIASRGMDALQTPIQPRPTPAKPEPALVEEPKFDLGTDLGPSPIQAEPLPAEAMQPVKDVVTEQPQAPGIRERLANLLHPERRKDTERLAQLERDLEMAVKEANYNPKTDLPGERAWIKARPAIDADPDTVVGSYDLNNFKKVNDLYGHSTGDKIITEAGHSVRDIAKSVDPHLRVFHPHGDEFVVAGPRDSMERFNAEVSAMFGERGPENAKVSIAGAIDDSFDAADAKLQQAKADAKGIPLEQQLAGRKAIQEAEQAAPEAQAPLAPESGVIEQGGTEGTDFSMPDGAEFSKPPPKKAAVPDSPDYQPRPAKNPHTGEDINPLDGPALHSFSKELVDEITLITGKDAQKYYGYLKQRPSDIQGEADKFELGLRADLGKDPDFAKRVMAHEVGHAIDRLPVNDNGEIKGMTAARGNVVGHLHALHKYMHSTFGSDKTPNNVYRQELIGLTEWWSPYDKTNASEKYVKYRNSSKELVAEGLSVLMNSPGELEARAPNFFNALFREMHRRPEAQTAWDEIQGFLRKAPAEQASLRSEEIKAGFARGQVAKKEKIAAQREGKSENDTTLREDYQDMFAQARGDKDVSEQIDRMVRTTEGWQVARKMDDGMRAVEASGATWDDVGELAKLERIAIGDRSNFINPNMWDADSGAKQLAENEARLGPEKVEAIRSAAEGLREINEQNLKELYELGIYSKKRYDELVADNRAHYYAPFIPVDFVEANPSLKIEHQKGTLREIANPATELALKLVQQKNFIQQVRALSTTLDAQEKLGFAHKAKLDANEKPIAEPGMTLVQRYRNGQPEHWNMDPVLARAFREWNKPHGFSTLGRIVGKLNEFQKSAYLVWNLAFSTIRQPIRDALRGWSVKPPDVKSLEVLYPWATKTDRELSRKFAKGERAPELDHLIDIGVLENYANGLYVGHRPTAKDYMLERMGLLEKKEPSRFQVVREKYYIQPLIKWLEEVSTSSEVRPKILMARILKEAGWKDEEMASFVRGNIGTPDYHKGGFSTPQTNRYMQFSNVMIQGLKADLDLMRSNPKVAGAYAARLLGLATIPLALQIAHEQLGDAETKEAYDKIPEFDKANNIVMWLGMWNRAKDGGRIPVYARIPLPESARIVKGTLYNAIKAASGDPSLDGIASTFSYAAGQMPSFTSNLQLAGNWAMFTTNGPTYDPFRNRPVVDETTRKAGIAHGIPDMLEYTAEQTGVKGMNPLALPGALLKGLEIPSTRTEQTPVRQSLRDEAKDEERAAARRTLNARKVSGAKSRDEVQRALTAEEISAAQAKRILREMGYGSDERFVRSRFSKDRQKQLLQE